MKVSLNVRKISVKIHHLFQEISICSDCLRETGKNNIFKRKIGTCGLTWKQSIKKLLNFSEVSFSNNSLVKNQ